MAVHFEPVMDVIFRQGAPPPTRRTAIDERPQVVSFGMLEEQLHYSKPVKHRKLLDVQRFVHFRSKNCFKLISILKENIFPRKMSFPKYKTRFFQFPFNDKPRWLPTIKYTFYKTCNSNGTKTKIGRQGFSSKS